MGARFFSSEFQSHRLAVGLMSGTSADGIDAAVVAISGVGEAVSAKLIAFSCTPFSADLRARIFDAFQADTATVHLIGALHMDLGRAYAKAALDVIEKAGLCAADIDVIGSHGQTIYHAPNGENGGSAFTVQIGDGNVLAQETGILCVSDFRTADLAAGGQGAPLVPFTEFLLYRSEVETVLLQNIGGIGNITVLPSGCTADEVIAFDTGPGNMVLDALVTKLTNGAQHMDVNGALAAGGTVNEPLLRTLLCHPFFEKAPPKTSGREMFGADYVEMLWQQAQALSLSDADLLATVTALTARSIEMAIVRFILPHYHPTRLIVGGGGSYNPTLLRLLQEALSAHCIRLETQEMLGHSSDAKEAIAFALLADCTVRGIPSALPAVTGADYAAILGKVSFPRRND
ncbi:MAG: anhydro-N-acetylmuramic acid kinase [Ruthenibacterium sp.]